MNRKLLYLFLLVPLVMGSSPEQTAPRSLAETFLAAVQKGEVSKAVDRLFEGSSIPKDKPQAIGLLKKQAEIVLPLYGKLLGYELVKEERFGTSLVRLVYVLKAEKHLTVWEFYFYKPGTTWFVSNVNFNDQFTLLGIRN